MKTIENKQQCLKQGLKWFKVLLIVTLSLGLLSSCSPYASLDVGVPFKVGPVYVNPRIGVGGFL